MSRQSHRTIILAAIAAVLPVTAAQAQYYGVTAQPAPLYPYAVQNPSSMGGRPYAVEVAPNTYEIRRSAPARAYPYVRSQSNDRSAANPAPERKPPRFDRPPKPVDHALVDELRKRQQKIKGTVINTQKIVRHPPVVRETRRYVDDPPRVIERHVVEDEPAPSRRKRATVEERDSHKRASRDDSKKRVIEADAEVTIIGPDRMSIRLFRKGQGPKANARAE